MTDSIDFPSGSADVRVRELLASVAGEARPSPIDVARVLGRARARRRSHRLAVVGAGAATVAAVGAAGFGYAALNAPTPLSAASGGETQPEPLSGAAGDPSTSGAAGGAISLAPPEKVNSCGAPLAELAPAESGLVATPRFAGSAAAGGTVTGSVVLTNTGSAHLVGYTGARPVITVSEDGITVWHSNGPVIEMALLIDLEPGASMELAATFEPVRCGQEDEMQEEFRADLPPLEPGAYDLSAIVPFIPEGAGAGFVEYVGGPLTPVVLE